ncbi:MAG: HAMP domain-containing protein [Desulfobacula sp.]|nr:HAMP domain-containing protein [Desulfobacula sp.]
MKKKATIRVPIFIKLIVFSCLLVIVITSSIGFLVLDIQKKQFKDQLIILGESLLHIMAKNAPDKLLAEEDMALFKLVKDISENEQIVSACITNQKNIIVAHSDLDQVNKTYEPPKNLLRIKIIPKDIILNTFDINGKEFLFLEKPLTYQNINIGNARIVISQKIIEQNIILSKRYILMSFVVILFLSLLMSLGFSIYFSRPINKLKKSVEIFGTGNYKHQAAIIRNDELGDLAQAFNQMAKDIALKEKIKDSFGRYVAPEIVDMILANPSDSWMKASLKQATVLFTDIRGFTSISENKEPESIVDILNEHFTQITDIIIRHGGHIDKFVGDAAMAVFGIIKENTGHAEDALKAALEIMNLTEAGAVKNKDTSEAVRIGIGINTGEMVAGNLGSKKKMEYTVIGDNVNIASRLTSLAEPGEILISGNTYDLLDKSDEFKVREKGRISIKGKKNKIRVFKLIIPG